MRVIAPRVPTAVPDALKSHRTGGWVPVELLSEQVKRLALVAAVGAAAWTVGLVVDVFIVPLTAAPVVTPWQTAPVEIAAIVVSVLMFAHARFGGQCHETKISTGLGYMIFSAAAVGYINTQVYLPTAISSNQISWSTLVILVSAMILHTPPRRMLVAGLVAASMDPLGIWVAALRGRPVPPVWGVVVGYWPNYLCAVIAMLPSSVLQRVGRRLREAQEFGSYRLVELLGHGGMGEVWRAEHRMLRRDVAIKLVRPEVLAGAHAGDTRVVQQRFEREARATAALSSPHTIRLFDYGTTEDQTLYYVMELLSGRDLETLIREFGPMPADRAVFLLRQVCHSLADAHARGLIHRDIKPANIYVCRNGLEYDFVKVLDFGLVKFKGPDAVRLTAEHAGQTSGTPAYMAPEIILGEADVDRRADVYALGCVAYYLVTGQLVFEADTSMKMLLQHVQERPQAPSTRTELKIPKAFDDLVLACLEKDPDDRPQDAGELFDLACSSTSCECWTLDSARAWWETHLPELTGPLSLGEYPSDVTAADDRRLTPNIRGSHAPTR